MSFQRAALSLKSKLHVSDLKTSTLALALLIAVAGMCTLIGAAVHAVSDEAFAVVSEAEMPDSMVDQVEFSNEFQSSSDSETTTQSLIVVYVSGSVKHPGVYELEEGSRVADAVYLAGGGTDEALLESVNLARVLFDGEQIHVPSKMDESSGSFAPASGPLGSASQQGQLININTASAEQLVSLNGVGEATADKIIAEREANGPFASKEDIMRVAGIGDKKYEAIKDKICV